MYDPNLRTNKTRIVTSFLLILIVIALAIVPMIMVKGAEFGGADDQAKDAIAEINGNYEPWFSLIWEPPSGEIASMLFALQAAIGAGILFYGIGYLRGVSKRKEN